MRYGALEAVQRVYGLTYEVKEYLKAHPRAAVVDMGAGLDDLFRRVDNGVCKGLNVDLADVIRIRDELAFPSEREVNLAYDLNDYPWMDEVDGEDGAVFAASGVLYYFTREEAERLIKALAGRFPKGALVFDCANRIGLGMMRKAVLSKAGMGSAKAYFSLTDPVREISSLSPRVGSVTAKSCMRGYRKLEGTGLLFRFLDWAADNVAGMRIVKVSFT